MTDLLFASWHFYNMATSLMEPLVLALASSTRSLWTTKGAYKPLKELMSHWRSIQLSSMTIQYVQKYILAVQMISGDSNGVSVTDTSLTSCNRHGKCMASHTKMCGEILIGYVWNIFSRSSRLCAICAHDLLRIQLNMYTSQSSKKQSTVLISDSAINT